MEQEKETDRKKPDDHNIRYNRYVGPDFEDS